MCTLLILSARYSELLFGRKSQIFPTSRVFGAVLRVTQLEFHVIFDKRSVDFIVWHCALDDRFSSFDTIRECCRSDRQCVLRIAYVSCGKNHQWTDLDRNDVPLHVAHQDC